MLWQHRIVPKIGYGAEVQMAVNIMRCVCVCVSGVHVRGHIVALSHSKLKRWGCPACGVARTAAGAVSQSNTG